MLKEQIEKDIMDIDTILESIDHEGTLLLAKKYQLLQDLRNISIGKDRLVVRCVNSIYEYWWKGEKIEPIFSQVRVIYPFSEEKTYDVEWRKQKVIRKISEDFTDVTCRMEAFYIVDINGAKEEMQITPDANELKMIPIMEE